MNPVPSDALYAYLIRDSMKVNKNKIKKFITKIKEGFFVFVFIA